MSVDQLQQLTQEALNTPLATEAEREAFRIHYLGRKGVLKDLAAAMKTIAPENRKEYGQALNALKQTVEQRLADFELASNTQSSTTASQYDFTRPTRVTMGARHPLALTQNRVIDIFARMGYSVSEGPEVEDDWHNFTALNFPPDHPARDMQDTFFVRGGEDLALRTHTSSVQIRVMENRKPPMRVLAPGRVYRNEAISARAHCFFHQIEGFYVNENVSFADLKLTLLTFARQMFGATVEIRMRPSYFPFTEPSAEVDVSCTLCSGKGCNVCKYTGWLEILGCGMIDPAVLSNCGIDPDKYSGFAFGMGVERMAQLLFRVSDLRYYSENDVRFLSQFRPVF